MVKDVEPETSPAEKLLYFASLVAMVSAAGYLLWQLFVPASVAPTYVALAALPLWVFVKTYVHLERNQYRNGLVDQSEVHATFVEAESIEARIEPDKRPLNYKNKKKSVQDEVEALREMRSRGWTAYRVLPLNQFLIEFLKVDELIERAKALLADLEEFAVDSSFSYELRKFDEWEARIDGAIEDVASQGPEEEKDERDWKAEPLRARTQALMEHLASYTTAWTEGTAIIRALTTVAGVALVVLLAMGTLPLWHADGRSPLDLFHWAVLGAAGSLVSVLRARASADIAEVGSTEGKREFWNSAIGFFLGLVSGTVLFSMLCGDLVSGEIFPDLSQPGASTDWRSVFWALSAGFSSDWVFERLRQRPTPA